MNTLAPYVESMVQYEYKIVVYDVIHKKDLVRLYAICLAKTQVVSTTIERELNEYINENLRY